MRFNALHLHCQFGARGFGQHVVRQDQTHRVTTEQIQRPYSGGGVENRKAILLKHPRSQPKLRLTVVYAQNLGLAEPAGLW